MDAIELKLRDIWEAAPCPAEKLTTVTEELTPEEVERITDAGQWSAYREEDQKKTLLPELGEERRFRSSHSFYLPDDDADWGAAPRPRPPSIVVPIRGRNYRVAMRVVDVGEDSDHEAKGKTLFLFPTDDPTTPFDGPQTVAPGRRNHYFKFFGQPVWVQNAHYPADLRGEPCCHLLTIKNGWGGQWQLEHPRRLRRVGRAQRRLLRGVVLLTPQ